MLPEQELSLAQALREELHLREVYVHPHARVTHHGHVEHVSGYFRTLRERAIRSLAHMRVGETRTIAGQKVTREDNGWKTPTWPLSNDAGKLADYLVMRAEGKHLPADEARGPIEPAKSGDKNVPAYRIPAGSLVTYPGERGVGVPDRYGNMKPRKMGTPLNVDSPETVSGIRARYHDGVQWDYVSPHSKFDVVEVPAGKGVHSMYHRHAAELQGTPKTRPFAFEVKGVTPYGGGKAPRSVRGVQEGGRPSAAVIAQPTPSAGRSARSPNGNLRNFKAMGDPKLQELAKTLAREGNDVPAMQAVLAELGRRMSESDTKGKTIVAHARVATDVGPATVNGKPDAGIRKMRSDNGEAFQLLARIVEASTPVTRRSSFTHSRGPDYKSKQPYTGSALPRGTEGDVPSGSTDVKINRPGHRHHGMTGKVTGYTRDKTQAYVRTEKGADKHPLEHLRNADGGQHTAPTGATSTPRGVRRARQASSVTTGIRRTSGVRNKEPTLRELEKNLPLLKSQRDDAARRGDIVQAKQIQGEIDKIQEAMKQYEPVRQHRSAMQARRAAEGKKVGKTRFSRLQAKETKSAAKPARAKGTSQSAGRQSNPNKPPDYIRTGEYRQWSDSKLEAMAKSARDAIPRFANDHNKQIALRQEFTILNAEIERRRLHNEQIKLLKKQARSSGPLAVRAKKRLKELGLGQLAHLSLSEAHFARERQIARLELAVGHEPIIGSKGEGLWHHKGLQLPAYIQHIANDMIQGGMEKGRAIPTAIAAVKRWCAGGGNVTAKTRAKACKAVAEWEKLKATH